MANQGRVFGMTRREEIEKVANEFYKGDEVSTFVVAAQWADKTMIEKACEWLKKCFYEQEHECDYGYYITLETTFDELNDVFDDFRKAMEE